jgi:hypothetical protein
MGLFDLLRRKDERAIPEPGTPEFHAAVQGSAIPDSKSVSMGEPGWTNPESAHQALQQLGIDPDREGQTINAASIPGLQESILRALGQAGIQIPEAGGFGGTIGAPQRDPLDQIAYLDQQRDAGKITDAELEAQKKRLLGE